MTPDGDPLYGRSEELWDRMTDEGLRFLRDVARLQRLTSYSELNDTLHRRAGAPRFDFALDSERAAMGRLLYRIVEEDRPESGLMISALVVYLNENDAGPGFYKLASEYGMLAKHAGAVDKLTFWSEQVKQLHERYGR